MLQTEQSVGKELHMQREKTGRQRLPKEVREQQILDAAFDCFCAKGYNGAGINDIVSASGISKGNLYWHFSSKEDIFMAVLDRWCTRLIDELTEDLEKEGQGISQVGKRLTDRLYQYTISDRFFKMASLEFDSVAGRDEAVRQRLVQIPMKFHDVLVRYFKRASANGEIRNLDPEILAHSFGSMFKGIISNGIVWPEKYANKKIIADIVMLMIDSIKKIK